MADLEWKREFEAMGAAGVRGALMASRWDNEKRSAAREWLERSDAMAWQSSRPRGASGAAPAKSSLDLFRRFRWVYALIGGGFGLLALSQMFHF